MQSAFHGYIEGKVQGVYYRQSTQQKAQALGLTGWVKNLADGRVELAFEGADAACAELAKWLETGPVDAKVTRVELHEQPVQGMQGFAICA